MNNTPQKYNDDQEIDLASISRKISSVFKGVNRFIFNSIQFAIRNVVILIVLLISGVGLGIYLDRTQKTFDHQVIVTPNFGSVDYMYSRIDLLNAKVRERDTMFLKAIGIADAGILTKIEIEPIVDVYNFINRSNSETNFQLLKLMAEDGNIKKIVEEPATSKNYTFHAISLSTRKRTSEKNMVDPILAYLNNNKFFNQVQKEAVNNVKLKMAANEQTIAQIDGFLNEFSANSAGGGKSSNLVYYNENSQLNDVIKTKDELVKEQGNHRLELIGMDRIVKENTVSMNIRHQSSVNGKMKYLLPLLFIFLYMLIRMFISFYKSQALQQKNLTA